MTFRRPVSLVVLFAFALTAAAVVQWIAASSRPAGAARGSLDRLEVSEDRRSLLGLEASGSVRLVYSVDRWLAWAQDGIERQLGGPVRIGDQVVRPSSFGAFDAAVLSPDGRRIAFVTSSYAMLTTVSLVALLELDDLSVDLVAEPAHGGVGEMVWSPDGRFVAYSLDTARAHGDLLRIDDVLAMQPAVTLAAEDLRAVMRPRQGARTSRTHDWLPGFRELEWREDGRLAFTVSDSESGEARWGIDPRDREPTPRVSRPPSEPILE